ncbi:MAG: hypothetical protein Q7R74_00070, partial [bacterium]|nr:hypothetical protein [bacterium]
LFLYEGWEAVSGIGEDVENAIADITCGIVGALLAYSCARLFFGIEPLLFILFLILDFGILFLGWRAYLERRLRRSHVSSGRAGPRARRSAVIFIGIAFAAIPVPLLSVQDPKFAITWFASLCLGTAYVLYRKSIGQELLIALLFSLFVTSYQGYVYTTSNLLLGRINLYPLVAWTAGLVLAREIYERIRFPYRWIAASILYIATLFCLEYVGYYVFGIHIAGNPPSLLGLGIIHGSSFIHWFYILAGPMYLLATDYLKVR